MLSKAAHQALPLIRAIDESNERLAIAHNMLVNELQRVGKQPCLSAEAYGPRRNGQDPAYDEILHILDEARTLDDADGIREKLMAIAPLASMIKTSVENCIRIEQAERDPVKY